MEPLCKYFEISLVKHGRNQGRIYTLGPLGPGLGAHPSKGRQATREKLNIALKIF